jgi:subtilisin-like proprotein convertase family protein
MGDYDQIAAATNTAFHSTWADNRDGNSLHANQPDVHYARIAPRGSGADIGVSVKPVPSSINMGSSTDVRVTVTASGSTAQDVFVNLSPADGLKFQSASGPSGSDCDVINQFVGCSLGIVTAGTSKTIHVTTVGLYPAGNRAVHAKATTSSNDANTANNTGSATVKVGGTATTNTYSTGNIAVAIPDSGTVDVPLSVPDVGTVLKTQAPVRLNHTFDSDLVFSLIDPSGHAVLLANRRGSSGDNYGSGTNDCAGTPTTFNDSAATPISGGVAPFAGSFKPEQPLTNLAGDPSAGTWKLHVSDVAPADTGTVGCFKLMITHP